MSESIKKTAKEVIAEGISALTEQLRSGNSAALTQYLSAMGKFHSYSFGNQMAIAMQMPDASRVAGFHKWHEFGRYVRKGAKGIRILAPIVGKKKDEANPEESKSMVFGFRSVYVFDVSQTDGQELPEFESATGEAREYNERLMTFAGSKGIVVSFEELDGALGLSCNGAIKIQNGQTDAETFATFSHELAHELLHKGTARNHSNQDTRELEAEAVAFIVGTAIGLNMGTSSADYIHLYNGNADALTESLAAISKASTEILTAIAA